MPEPGILVVNAGSSSLKVKLFPAGDAVLVERIGGDSNVVASFGDVPSRPVARHDGALRLVLDLLEERLPPGGIAAVGHRVVHGGVRYSRPVRIDHAVEAIIEELSALAPLHNPANLEGIRAARALLPAVPHVAVFDTAFHAGMPRRAFLFGLPMRLFREGRVRRYGFHGTSHDYVTRRAAEFLGRPREALKLVSLHLGNGASAAAVDEGRSVDTSMGFTPLDGLLMGTRSGAVDPGVLIHLLRKGEDVDSLDAMLNRESGLLGLSGVSNDMRDVRLAADAGNDDAVAALDVFAYRIGKTVGAYAAAMGGLDAIVFTGGIGENDARIRQESLAGLGFLGVRIDAERNRRGETRIGVDGAGVEVLVVATDEERMIADATGETAGLEGCGARAAGGRS
ncbi:MAG TPA: acetate kinase [Trueperaceae bacterium]|nr:acetate kinase [Trueperaceae bacterium]